ncbi:MAG: exodeoxyribonuclease VII small subunit [Blastocatellia bacterium]|nr:exodeoxyribonuclease VII small subunit [Blastocatellia bacterium]
MEKPFETSLNELEKIVNQLENGDLPLEKSLSLFEDGVKLSRACRERLIQAERRIEVLLKDSDGNLSLKEIEPESLRAERKTQTGKRIVFDEDDIPF